MKPVTATHVRLLRVFAVLVCVGLGKTPLHGVEAASWRWVPWVMPILIALQLWCVVRAVRRDRMLEIFEESAWVVFLVWGTLGFYGTP